MKPEIQSLLLEKLNQAFQAEQTALAGLSKMAEAASSPALRQLFETHQTETKHQITTLTQIGQQLQTQLTGAPCEALDGLTREAMRLIEEHPKGALRDVLLVCAAQGIEHHEIAAYGTIASLTRAAGQQEIASLVTEILDQEKATDVKLTQLAESEINPAAMQ